ncbi:MAG: hypothetical protein K2Q24_08255 [Chitinophagaceae bacterium]|jgi:hypothetical protein|nr:hypothetical protein [Chitinophagaceae bacterium]
MYKGAVMAPFVLLNFRGYLAVIKKEVNIVSLYSRIIYNYVDIQDQSSIS